MKLLLLSDEEDSMLWEHLDRRRLQGFDLILSCGDLSPKYLSFLTCFTTAPILYVPGNHDDRYQQDPPEGCVCIDGRLSAVNGLRILGLGGSMRYRPGPCQYTEEEMTRRIRRLRLPLLRHRGFDVLVTHSPMRGVGDLDDRAHTGFACFEGLIKGYAPALFAFTHVHQSYGGSRFQRCYHVGDTVALNAYRSYGVELERHGGRWQVIDHWEIRGGISGRPEANTTTGVQP